MFSLHLVISFPYVCFYFPFPFLSYLPSFIGLFVHIFCYSVLINSFLTSFLSFHLFGIFLVHTYNTLLIVFICCAVIPALRPIVYDLFDLQGTGRNENSKELDTQREVFISMLLRLARFPEVSTGNEC